MTSPVKQEPEWLAILRADAAVTGSISETAKRVGVSRPAVSQILNGIGPYGTGRASTAKVADKVMNTIGLVACPFLSQYHSKEHRITGLQCRDYAYRANPPTNSPRDMQHWRACQGCEKRVKPAGVTTAPVPMKPTQKIGKVGPVNNEIYVRGGKASSPAEAEDEGWNSIGGPQDNPYPVEDQRHDYWEHGYKARRELDRQQNSRLKGKGEEPQQAGVIDKVTLPLPEVGGPQVEGEIA